MRARPGPIQAFAHGGLGLALERRGDLAGPRLALARSIELGSGLQEHRDALARVQAALADRRR